MSARFQKIDDQNRAEHSNLIAGDQCYYIYEYTSGHDYRFGATNSLISNFKKKPSLSGTAQYKYKGIAIQECGIAFGEAINANWLPGATLVPVPPSKIVGDPEYDDRILKICRAIPCAVPIDIRELVTQRVSLGAAHEGGHRPTIEELIAVYEIDESKAQPTPKRVAIVDDVLTVGTHFKAMEIVLKKRFAAVSVVGFFVARRILPNSFEAVDITGL